LKEQAEREEQERLKRCDTRLLV